MPTARYEIRIRGRLSGSLGSAFDPLTAYVEPPATVFGGIEDQAALQAVLQRLQPSSVHTQQRTGSPSWREIAGRGRRSAIPSPRPGLDQIVRS